MKPVSPQRTDDRARVAVIKASEPNPAPDQFYLAGGPGSAATGSRKQCAVSLSLSKNHDLVFVDQRGTVVRMGDPNRWTRSDWSDPAEVDTKAKAW
jgi:hypothetical protein